MKKQYWIVKDGNFENCQNFFAIEKSDGLYQVNGSKMIGQDASGNKVHLQVGKVNETTEILRLEDWQAGFKAFNAKKTETIQGLKELEDAINQNSYAAKLAEDRIANADYRPINITTVSVDDLRAKYPVASAYLAAKNYEFASNNAKREAGKKAMARIEAGENHETVIAEMEAEWTKSAMENVD